MAWLHNQLINVLTHVPRPVMRQLSSRYIAGEHLDEAIARLVGLAEKGFPGIIDILGEDVREEGQARAVLEEYKRAADAIAGRRLDAYVSVKPTHMGLKLGEDLAHSLYEVLARHCAELGLFLRVEMEDHPTTDATLRLFARLRTQFENVGIVLQSRLLRTPEDIAALPAGPLSVRMVKGIYLEPASVAHVEAGAISEAFVECCRALFERGAFVSLATHDAGLAERLLELIRTQGVEPERFEFQVLLGVQEQLWTRWQHDGHKVRVYVPFGPEWLAYSLRRLRKNPKILGHVVRSTLRL